MQVDKFLIQKFISLVHLLHILLDKKMERIPFKTFINESPPHAPFTLIKTIRLT